MGGTNFFDFNGDALCDVLGNVVLAKGPTVPTDTTAGYVTGCQFLHTDGTIGTAFYVNEGSVTSCDFNAMETSASTITGITATDGLVGTATSGVATLALGLDVRNNTGSTILKGSLVRVVGYASSRPLIVLADADTAGAAATHVMAADLATATNGTAYSVSPVTDIATNAFSVGDPIYLSATAGGFSTAPTGPDQIVQQVGIVILSHATTGSALFFPGSSVVSKVGTTGIQPLSIGTAEIKAAAAIELTKLAALARGSVIVGATAGNVPTALDANDSAKILIGDGTDLVSLAVTGDVTISAAAVTAIGAAKVLTGMINESVIQYAEYSLTEANIIAMGTTAVLILAAPGSGKAIEFVSATVIYDYDTATYTGGGDATIVWFGGTTAVSNTISSANSFGAAGDKITQCVALDSANGIPLLTNTGLAIYNTTAAYADPGTAAGVGRIKISYRIHTTGL